MRRVESQMMANEMEVVKRLQAAGVTRGDSLGFALARDARFAIAVPSGVLSFGGDDGPVVVSAVEDTLRPRWTWWSSESAEMQECSLEPVSKSKGRGH